VSDFETSTCGCGRTIVWGKLPSGGKVPLDPVAPVYRIAPGDGVAYRVNGKAAPVPNDGGTYFVSHFATCSRASKFSKGGRR
jgi:hypothetical protein